MTEKKKRGFAAISPERRREIAAMGGRAVQLTDNARRWKAGDKGAVEAGRKGGLKAGKK